MRQSATYIDIPTDELFAGLVKQVHHDAHSSALAAPLTAAACHAVARDAARVSHLLRLLRPPPPPPCISFRSLTSLFAGQLDSGEAPDDAVLLDLIDPPRLVALLTRCGTNLFPFQLKTEIPKQQMGAVWAHSRNCWRPSRS